MKVAIAGGGNVGRSIARELLGNGHQVLLLERDAQSLPETTEGLECVAIDACEVQSLQEIKLEDYDAAIAATGDDKVNLVFSLLAKTEFGIPRTVARVNDPTNEWLFDKLWGVDVCVSTPRLLCALAEEALTVGDLVRLFSFKGSNLVEMTLPEHSPRIGQRVGDLRFPGGAVLVSIIRDEDALPPDKDAALEANDELLFVIRSEFEQQLAKYLVPRPSPEED